MTVVGVETPISVLSQRQVAVSHELMRPQPPPTAELFRLVPMKVHLHIVLVILTGTLAEVLPLSHIVTP